MASQVSDAFGTKTEIKNVNSFRFIREALEYEIERHIEVIEGGGSIQQETRLYNANEGRTYGMRSKEQAHDYRYFPEPDLLPLVVDARWQEEIRKMLPELPEARRKRMVSDYGITEYDAQVLTVNKSLADQFEEAARAAKNPKRVANLVQSELMGRLKARGLDIERSPISMKGIAASADLVEAGTISGKMLKDFYDLSFERGKDFPAVYDEEGRPHQFTDTSALEKMIEGPEGTHFKDPDMLGQNVGIDSLDKMELLLWLEEMGLKKELKKRDEERATASAP